MEILSIADLEIPLPDTAELPAGDIEDPLSPAELAAQTRRLCLLIARAKRQADVVLLHSLRRELLVTRWALVKTTMIINETSKDQQTLSDGAWGDAFPPEAHKP